MSKEIEEENLKLKEKIDSVMVKAYWPSTVEVLKVLPREIVETQENEFAEP
jgi:hypothetical protein